MSLWFPIGVFGVPVAGFGATLGSLGSLWGDFGISFALLGTLGFLEVSLAPSGLPCVAAFRKP